MGVRIGTSPDSAPLLLCHRAHGSRVTGGRCQEQAGGRWPSATAEIFAVAAGEYPSWCRPGEDARSTYELTTNYHEGCAGYVRPTESKGRWGSYRAVLMLVFWFALSFWRYLLGWRRLPDRILLLRPFGRTTYIPRAEAVQPPHPRLPRFHVHTGRQAPEKLAVHVPAGQRAARPREHHRGAVPSLVQAPASARVHSAAAGLGCSTFAFAFAVDVDEVLAYRGLVWGIASTSSAAVRNYGKSASVSCWMIVRSSWSTCPTHAAARYGKFKSCSDGDTATRRVCGAR